MTSPHSKLLVTASHRLLSVANTELSLLYYSYPQPYAPQDVHRPDVRSSTAKEGSRQVNIMNRTVTKVVFYLQYFHKNDFYHVSRITLKQTNNRQSAQILLRMAKTKYIYLFQVTIQQALRSFLATKSTEPQALTV